MNDSDLEKILKSSPPPERPPEFWEQLPRHITTKIHWQGARAKTSPARPVWMFARIAGVAAVCLLAGFLVGHWRGSDNANARLRNEKLVREVLAMFPNQVQAILQDEKGVHLVLADKPDVPNSTPLLIKVCEGRQCRSIITFSGQTVQIAGERVEVLADPKGDVMLMGENFFWSRGAHLGSALRIEAQPLSYSM